MNWKKALRKSGLVYLILDQEVFENNNMDIIDFLIKALKCAVDIFQFRFKNVPDRRVLNTALNVSRLIHGSGKFFIVNDRPDIALMSGADGLHLGEEDIPYKYARKIMGREKIIGKSIHSAEEFTLSRNKAWDYLSFGPVFPTKTKPGLPVWDHGVLRNITKKLRKPCFAIGGINRENAGRVVNNLGIRNIAVCRSIVLHRDYCKAAKELKDEILQGTH